MMNCMCGGCDTCLKDQGVLTEAQERAELAIYNIAHGNLTEQFARLNGQAMTEAVDDAMAYGIGLAAQSNAIIAMTGGRARESIKHFREMIAIIREHYISERIEDEIKRVRHDIGN